MIEVSNIGVKKLVGFAREIGPDNFRVLRQLSKSVAKSTGEEFAKGIAEFTALNEGKANKATVRMIFNNKELLDILNNFKMSEVTKLGSAEAEKTYKSTKNIMERLCPKSYGEGSKTELALSLKKYGKNANVLELTSQTSANGEQLAEASFKYAANDAGTRFKLNSVNNELNAKLDAEVNSPAHALLNGLPEINYNVVEGNGVLTVNSPENKRLNAYLSVPEKILDEITQEAQKTRGINRFETFQDVVNELKSI